MGCVKARCGSAVFGNFIFARAEMGRFKNLSLSSDSCLGKKEKQASILIKISRAVANSFATAPACFFVPDNARLPDNRFAAENQITFSNRIFLHKKQKGNLPRNRQTETIEWYSNSEQKIVEETHRIHTEVVWPQYTAKKLLNRKEQSEK
ncbi:hypothetical protein ACRQV7_09035 [Caproiciproducens sp. R2]|uniref:hypothetical protein n=1 Tax=Caproiciproducens sp. R2 TaxID=3435187 RepID=UPI0040347368